jgi:hypothetical protein
MDAALEAAQKCSVTVLRKQQPDRAVLKKKKKKDSLCHMCGIIRGRAPRLPELS